MLKPDFIVAVHIDDLKSLGRVRGLLGVCVCVESDTVWVKETVSNENVRSALRTLPGRKYFLNDARGLVPVGCRLATESLPEAKWMPLDDWLKVEFPVANWPGLADRPVTLELHPSDIIVDSSAVLTSIDELIRIIDEAELRFRHLKFAMSSTRQVFVIGAPLPAVSGQRFWLSDNIAVPAGHRWVPEIGPATVRKVFGNPNGIVLWLATDHWQLIPFDGFTSLTRSAARASLAAANQVSIIGEQ